MNSKQYQNFKKAKAIETSNKNKLIKHFGNIPDTSGIYILTREECYIGQSKHILTRIAEHLQRYDQHIDMSLKKYGLNSEENTSGWKLKYITTNDLDEAEKKFIKLYQKDGYHMLNKTAGGQGEGKTKINEFKPAKGYRDGLEQGRNNLIKRLQTISKYLYIKPKKENKTSQRMYEEFIDLIGGDDDTGTKGTII